MTFEREKEIRHRMAVMADGSTPGIIPELLAEIDRLRGELDDRWAYTKIREKLAVAEKKYNELKTAILWSGSNDFTPPDTDGWKKIISIIRDETNA